MLWLFGVVCDYVVAKSKSLTCILTKQSFVFQYDVVTDYAERRRKNTVFFI